jgi:hypothetical protein
MQRTILCSLCLLLIVLASCCTAFAQPADPAVAEHDSTRIADSSAAAVDRSFLRWQADPVYLGSSLLGSDVESAHIRARQIGTDLVMTVTPNAARRISPDSIETGIAIRISGGRFADGSRNKEIRTHFGNSDSSREIRLPVSLDSRLSEYCPDASPADLRAAADRFKRPQEQWYMGSEGGWRGSYYSQGFGQTTFSVPVPGEINFLCLRSAHWNATHWNWPFVGFTMAEFFYTKGIKNKVVIVPTKDHELRSGDTVKIGDSYSILPINLDQYVAVHPHWNIKTSARAHPFMFLPYKPASKTTHIWWNSVLDASLDFTVWLGKPKLRCDSIGGLVSMDGGGSLGLRFAVGTFLTGAPKRWAVEVNSHKRWRVPQPRGFYTRVDVILGGADLFQGIPGDRLSKWSKQVARQINGTSGHH